MESESKGTTLPGYVTKRSKAAAQNQHHHREPRTGHTHCGCGWVVARCGTNGLGILSCDFQSSSYSSSFTLWTRPFPGPIYRNHGPVKPTHDGGEKLILHLFISQSRWTNWEVPAGRFGLIADTAYSKYTVLLVNGCTHNPLCIIYYTAVIWTL